jgi:GNAT superfamily N-acetyltransferase
VIRPGGLGDASALAGIQVRAWHRMFADLVHPELTPDTDDQTGAWTEALAAGVEVLVADVAPQARGFAAMGPARDDDAGTGTRELYGLYVDPTAQGAGLGSALLEAAVDALRFGGAASAVVWTPVENPAREWLERHGWFADAGPVDEHGPLGVPEIRHRRVLP